MDEFLREIFAALSEQRVNYCVLRGYDPFPTLQGEIEIDLLVLRSDLSILAHALACRGFAAIPSWGYAPHHFFVAYRERNDIWVKIDVVTDLRFGKPIRAFRIGSAADCLHRRRSLDVFYVLSPEDEFFTLFLHCLMDKGLFEPEYRVRLGALQRDIASRGNSLRLVVKSVARWLAPAITWEILSRAIDLQDWESLAGRRNAVVRQLLWHDPVRTCFREFAGRTARRLRPVLFASQRRGFAVALLAPDGAGKTTLARRLALERHLRAKPIYMGGNPESSTVGLPTTRWFKVIMKRLNTSRWDPRRLLLRGFNFGNRLAEQLYRAAAAFRHMLRGGIVVFDRYIYDSWIHGNSPTAWKRLPRSLVEAGCPTPDLVILLDAPGEKLFSRKGEHTPEWLERQRQGYLGLRDRLPGMVVVDAGRQADEVRKSVISLIWDRYANRPGKAFHGGISHETSRNK